MAPEGLYAAFRRFSHRLVQVSNRAEGEKIQMYNRLTVRLRSHPLYRSYIDYITENFKTFTETVKTQYKGVIAQRIRRTIEYENTHGHKSLIRFLQSLRNAFWRRKGAQLSALFAASLFQWNEEAITDQEISRAIDDMSEIQDMGRHHQLEGAHSSGCLKDWTLVVNEPSLKIWRRPLPHSHLYEYKVYGRYDDVSPAAFYQVQIDLEYRKKWDHFVVKLDVIDKDPQSKSEVVQWVTNYPATWYSREFLYIRKFKVDKQKNVMAYVARAVDHPECPRKDDMVRVDTYSSYMVIKPRTTFSESGLEYVMTYHDDPQLMYSSLAFSFATRIGVDFVDKMHKAAKELESNSGYQAKNITSCTNTIAQASTGSYIPNYQ
uniref:Phosphatidylcholine transfer protein n=1 Tax=Crassostrea virginica TaxID=6565 RepID=A0A8B8F1C3_CRAVI|nr:stAR-related lipid transfer protein 7, mitochondrial-like [Crassostrea virginica]